MSESLEAAIVPVIIRENCEDDGRVTFCGTDTTHCFCKAITHATADAVRAWLVSSPPSAEAVMAATQAITAEKRRTSNEANDAALAIVALLAARSHIGTETT